MSWIWINGHWTEDTRPVISVKDRGFLYGDGIFETLRAYDGEVFQLREHWERLSASAAFFRIPVPATLEQMGEVIARLLRNNGHVDAVVRMTLSRGASSPGLALDGPVEPNLIVQSRTYKPFPTRIYRKGATLVIARVRQNADSPLPQHKTANYLLHCLARQEARDVKANDALLLNQHGQVCETSVANVFWVKGGRLFTPPVHCGLLAGITRANVLRLAERDGIETQEKAIQAGEIFDADEVFMTNSLIEVAPVRKIDDRSIGESAPGPVTERLMALYSDRAAWAGQAAAGA